ncbi:RNA polymerase sigma-70 factor (ECF subfamily) [Nakamurella sp. UYEF19]|uniref:RNA polymerase subunit sigma-70 n=1 Tax=Nakamurella sp. UYEF19 TaxID=1756392 RepID=UPI003395C7F9
MDHLSVVLEEQRRPLTGLCYRMLGSAADTDDAVQETMIRVIAHAGRYDAARGAVGPWIFRIAANVCLDMLRSRGRRALAMDLGPAAEAGSPLGVALPPERWIEPMPDSRVIAASDPAAVVVERETVRLAFIAALQYLPPRQRAVLILRDVLQYSAGETAEILDTSTAGVNSALQRAKATMARHRPEMTDPLDETDETQRALLERYVNAFQRHDIDELTAVLRADARSSMPPFLWWVHCARVLAELMTNGACDGARLVPTAINGSPGFGQYRPDADDVLRPFGIVLVEIYQGAVTHVVTFLGTADRFTEFGLPPTLTAPGGRPTDELSARRT